VMIKGRMPDQRVTIQLFSPQGTLVEEQQMNNNPERINIGNFARGIYYIRVWAGRATLDTQKLFIR
jgi:hypothetical protein